MSRTNKLIGFCVLLFVGLCIWIILMNSGGSSQSSTTNSTAIPDGAGPQVNQGTEGDPGADTADETLKTVAAGYQNVRTELSKAQAKIIELQNQKSSGNSSIASESLNDVKNEIKDLKNAFSTLARGEDFPDYRNKERPDEVLPADEAFHQIDQLDLGFSGQALSSEIATDYVRVTPLYKPQKMVMTSNLPDDGLSKNTESEPSLINSGPLQQVTNPGLVRSPFADNQTGSLYQDGVQIEPYLTIPPNATLFDSTSMTALIGRVPIGSSVVDPLPVKIIIGRENLVANGHRISGLNGMVFSGSAVGDWTLSCVRVRLHTATFVFDDGSYTALGAGLNIDDASQSISRDAGTTTAEGGVIGWLSDPQGNPCIPGKKISDAPKRLTTLSLLGLAQGAAGAYASSEETNVVSNDSSISSVTGNNTQFLIGNAASTGIDSAIQVMQERFADNFDAIYAPPGTPVVVNVDKELRIDRRSNQRKLHYARGKAHVSNTLD